MSAVVGRAYFGLLAARSGEGVLFGAAAAALVLAALALSAARAPDGTQRWAVALLGGLLAGAAWLGEHLPSRAGVARELDRRLRHGGALVTAWELEARAERTPLAALLCRHVLTQLRPRAAIRALRPSLALPLAAPLLAAAVLSLTLELRQERPAERGADLGALAAGLATRLSQAADHARASELDTGLDAAAVGELLALADEARALAVPGALSDSGPRRGELEGRLAELERRLADIAPRLRRNAALAESLDGARTWLDALRAQHARLGEAQRDGEPAAVSGLAPRGGEGDVGRPSAAHGAGTAAETPAPAPDPASTAGAAPSADEPSADAPAARPGGVGRWWGPEVDDVVRGWIESRRRALADEEESR